MWRIFLICIGFLHILGATEKGTMCAPDKNGNFAKCALWSAGTSREEQATSKVSARDLQGTCKEGARIPQGCSKYVPGKSLGHRKRPAEELQETCRPEQRSRGSLTARDAARLPKRAPRKYKHENKRQCCDAIRIRKTG
jgi:hypothetical protein